MNPETSKLGFKAHNLGRTQQCNGTISCFIVLFEYKNIDEVDSFLRKTNDLIDRGLDNDQLMYYLGYHRVLHKTTNHYYNLLFDRVDLIPDGTIFTKAKLVELDLPIDISDKQVYSRYY